MESLAKILKAFFNGVIVPLAFFCIIYLIDKETIQLGKQFFTAFMAIPTITVTVLFYYFLRKTN